MGRKRTLAISLVSIWLAWTLFMWFAATGSFRAADHALEPPQAGFVQLIRPASSSRVVLMGFAAAVNAAYFRAYGLAQIALGILLLALLGSVDVVVNGHGEA